MDSTELKQFFTSTWASTIRNLRVALDVDDRETIDTYKTWDDVVKRLPHEPPSSLTLLRPALGHLQAFTGYFQSSLGVSLDASYLCGSVVCLLKLILRYPEVSEHIPRMVKSLALKAEAFNGYLAKIPIDCDLVKEVCFDIQLQFVDFITSSIKNIRTAQQGERAQQHPGPQQRIQRSYQMAMLLIEEALSRLEKLATIRMPNTDKETTQLAIKNPGNKQRLLMLPPARTSRLFDRVDIFVRLDDLLTPDAGEFSLQSVALHGLGGVGKSSIASSYAEKKFAEQTYDVVLWACAEKAASLKQSFTQFARRLKLPGNSDDENLLLVHDWLQTSACKWLIIYDNVESAEMLAPYWPRGSPRGRAIITTRNRTLAFDPAASGLEVGSWDAETGSEFLLFLLKESIGRDINSESASARTLSERLSGHALAILHLAGLIFDGEYSVQEFTTMYLQSPEAAHAMDEFKKLWDLSFERLYANSFSLLGVLSFLMPDNIPPEILEPESHRTLLPQLQFLQDKFTGFSAAVRKLTRCSLIKRDKDTGIITVHRLVQTQFRYFLGAERCQTAFDTTVMLLSYVIPGNDEEKGQLYDDWVRYSRYLQHVLNLRDIFDAESKTTYPLRASIMLCEMLKGYQRYLFESFAFEECEKTCAVNRAAAATFASNEYRVDLEATCISHQAQVLDALGSSSKAIELCQEGIDLRLDESPRKHVLLSFSACNLGIFYGSTNNYVKARECFEQSRQWWNIHFELKGEVREFAANVLVFEARCMIGLNELAKAEEMLQRTLTLVKAAKPLNFGTLAYACFCMGTLCRRQHKFDVAEACLMEAQNAWLTGDRARLHPLNAAILYKIAACCLDQGKIEASIKHIRDSLEVTEFHSRTMPVEHARNLFKLSQALDHNGEQSATEAMELREKAAFFLRKRDPEAIESGTESAYDDLITMNWK